MGKNAQRGFDHHQIGREIPEFFIDLPILHKTARHRLAPTGDAMAPPTLPRLSLVPSPGLEQRPAPWHWAGPPAAPG